MKVLDINKWVFGDERSNTLIKGILSGKLEFPADGKTGIILHGNFGTGKTTLAKQIPEALDAGAIPRYIACGTSIADDIDSVMRQIKWNPVAGNLHWFIWDELDTSSNSQQKRLKHLLNSNYQASIITTNYLGKIDDGLLDRCYVLNMNPTCNAKDYEPHIKRLAKERFNRILSKQELDIITNNGEDSWREMIATLKVVCCL